MVVKNEDRFIWFAITSILPFVDELRICDTGSTDQTVKIISKIKDKKIKFSQNNVNTRADIGKVRQLQLDQSNSDWILLIDGDEVYPDYLLSEITGILEKTGNRLEGIVVGRFDLLGDIYHYQDNSAGFYDLWGKKGHFALRLINKKNIPGLHIEGIYPYEGYYDKKGKEIISHCASKFYFTKGCLHHAMYLQRSSLNARLSDTFNRFKYKIEKGIRLTPQNIPRVFYGAIPVGVPDVRAYRPVCYELVAEILTPIKKLKRRFY